MSSYAYYNIMVYFLINSFTNYDKKKYYKACTEKEKQIPQMGFCYIWDQVCICNAINKTTPRDSETNSLEFNLQASLLLSGNKLNYLSIFLPSVNVIICIVVLS